MIKIKEILDIYKPDQLNDFLLKYTGFTLEEKHLTKDKIFKNWKFVGGSESNGSQINILKYGEKGLVERVTNAIDAVIEKQKEENGLVSPPTAESVIKKAFPKYYDNRIKIAENLSNASYSHEAENCVVLAINDCSKSNKPTFDILDKGTGIEGERFKDTILSLNKGNKLASDKSYLIGAFGQGGSTSLAFATATIIISKFNNKYYFTVVKKVDLDDYKNACYVYLTIDEKIPEIDGKDDDIYDDYINDYLSSESGTFVRMVETDISKQFRDNEVTKPGMLHDYLNSELFNVGLPVKVIENRKMYSSNRHIQNRNVYGTFSKLQTWKYVQKDYSGSMDILFRDTKYSIDYYAILPTNEDDWGKDGKCKEAFEQFNVTLDPFMYIVNGQKIATESFAKLKNAGLNFMRYRLLVVINLDLLGNEKYKYFTTDRAQIKETDQTKELFDTIVKNLVNVDKLKELNTIISEKAVSSTIDENLINEISQEVKGLYNNFLKAGSFITSSHGHPLTPSEEIYDDYISKFLISNTKESYYKNQAINIILETGAMKNINQNAKIECFLDDKANTSFTPSVMNGRIQYSFSTNVIKHGSHHIYFVYYRDPNNLVDILESNKYSFGVLDENSPEKATKQRDKMLDLEIIPVDDQELICDISKNTETGKIKVLICLNNEPMMTEIFSRSSADEAKEMQAKLIKPVALFALLLKDNYDKIESLEEKNDFIISFIKTIIATGNIV